MSILELLVTEWSGQNRKEPARKAKPNVLVITADDRFYSSLMYVSTQLGWAAKWTRSIEYALEILDGNKDPIVLYDNHRFSEPWPIAAGKLFAVKKQSCIVLAVPHVDQQLWDIARGLKIYDVVSRTGPSADLAATLDFAWKWQTGREAAVKDSVSCIGSGIPAKSFW